MTYFLFIRKHSSNVPMFIFYRVISLTSISFYPICLSLVIHQKNTIKDRCYLNLMHHCYHTHSMCSLIQMNAFSERAKSRAKEIAFVAVVYQNSAIIRFSSTIKSKSPPFFLIRFIFKNNHFSTSTCLSIIPPLLRSHHLVTQPSDHTAKDHSSMKMCVLRSTFSGEGMLAMARGDQNLVSRVGQRIEMLWM